MKGALHGILAMLSGQGEKKSREMRRAFEEAIPDYGTDRHPAVSGPLANSSEGFGYRRANQSHGPLSKWDHAVRAEHRRTHNPDGSKVEAEAGWLARVLTGRR